ncbi:MAG: helix-turn-helix transcriptional regulator [Alphaproteobacteria bacterium]
MLEIEALQSAAAEFTSAALIGENWESAIERLAFAAGARGGALLRNNKDYKVASVICSPEIRDPVKNFIAGQIPLPSRQTRLDFRHRDGFRFDYDDYSEDDLARDPYYQEFLRPIGFFWHAAVALDAEDGENIAISLKRPLKAGPYQPADARLLNTIVPEMRAAVRIARHVLSAEGTGVARLLRRRGLPVFELDFWGRVLRTHLFTDSSGAPVRVSRERLVATDRLVQPALEQAVARGVTPPGSPGVVALSDANGERRYLQIVPVAGPARDIFRATAAVAVLIPHQPGKRNAADYLAIRDAFSLTDRETDVALMLANGLSPIDIAKQLRIQVDTARDHLKSIFEKTETNRQAELVALLSRLQP